MQKGKQMKLKVIGTIILGIIIGVGIFIYNDIKQDKSLNMKKKCTQYIPPSVLLLNNKFAIINVHIIYGKNNSIGKYNRIKEILALEDIIKSIKKKYKIKNIIIAGDFNMDFKDNMSKIIHIKMQTLDLRQYINEPTTIGNTAKNRFNKSYDHFLSNGLSVNAKVDTEIYTHRKQTYFNKKVSDHLPISGTFTFVNKNKKNKKK